MLISLKLLVVICDLLLVVPIGLFAANDLLFMEILFSIGEFVSEGNLASIADFVSKGSGNLYVRPETY